MSETAPVRLVRRAEAVPNNLPTRRSSFVGREREIARVRSLLAGRRLVTLAGTGGAGKTRLALEAGAAEVGGYPDGVFFVDLTPRREPEDIGRAVASAMGLATGRGGEGRTIGGVLVAHLAPRRVLLLVDNCEHVLGPVSELVELLLEECPKVVICATSREPLGVEGEQVYRVPPLSTPRPGEDARESESVRLFLERARAVREDYAPDPEEVSGIAGICRRLDGIPLAIELAAARVSHLSPAQILDRLGDSLQLLRSSRRCPDRQQTLEGALDWSHELLTEAEQTVFRRLGVFPASFDLEAAESVAGDESIPRGGVLDLLGSLVSKSLVTTVEESGDLRYRLLETVRAYTLGKLRAADESDATFDRHRDHYLSILESDRYGTGVHGVAWARFAAIEIEHLRAVAARAIEADRIDVLGRLAARTAQGLLYTPWQTEAEGWLTRAVEDPDRLTPALRIACWAWISFCSAVGSGGGNVELATKAIDLSGDEPSYMLAIARMGRAMGRYHLAGPPPLDADTSATVLEDFQSALDVCRAIGDRYWEGVTHCYAQGMHPVGSEEPIRHLREALHLLLPLRGIEGVVAMNRSTLGTRLYARGLHEEGVAEALAGLQSLADGKIEQFRVPVVANGAPALAGGGRTDEAVRHLRALLVRALRVNYPANILVSSTGNVAWIAGHAERAARLLASARHVPDAVSGGKVFVGLTLSELNAVHTELARDALGPEAARLAEAEGAAMTREDAIRYALETLDLLDESGDETAPATGAVEHVANGPRGSSAGTAVAHAASGSGEASPATATAAPFDRSPMLQREGEVWAIAFNGTSFRLKDSKGLGHIDRLLRHPGREFHALELVHGDAPSNGSGAAHVEGTRSAPDLGDAGDLLDPQARDDYKRRLEDLRAELAASERANDIGRAGKLRSEIDFLSQELSAAFGVGGRSRKAASTAERARVNVTRTIKDAIKRIATHSPDLAAYFDETIRTGTFCSYGLPE